MTERQLQHFIHMVLRNAQRMGNRAEGQEGSRLINRATRRAGQLGFNLSDRHNTAERLMGCVRIIERVFKVRLAVMSPADEVEEPY